MHKHSWFYTKTEPFFRWMEDGYKNSLSGFMRVRWMAFVIVVICGGIIFFIGKNIPSELAPMEDRSQFRVQLTGPEGTAYDAMDDYVDRVADFMLDSIPEKQTVLSITAPGFSSASTNSGMVRVSLVDPEKRERSQKEIVEMVNRNLLKYNDGSAPAIASGTVNIIISGSIKLSN